jgi:hypothetical protein
LDMQLYELYRIRTGSEYQTSSASSSSPHQKLLPPI